MEPVPEPVPEPELLLLSEGEPAPMPEVLEPVPDPEGLEPEVADPDEPDPEVPAPDVLEPGRALELSAPVPEPKVDELLPEPLPEGVVVEPGVELLERLPVPALLRSPQAAREADRPMATAVMNKPFVICMMNPYSNDATARCGLTPSPKRRAWPAAPAIGCIPRLKWDAWKSERPSQCPPRRRCRRCVPGEAGRTLAGSRRSGAYEAHGRPGGHARQLRERKICPTP